METNKKCPNCGDIKNLDSFYVSTNKCKKCTAEYYKKNRYKVLMRSKKHYADNIDKIKHIQNEHSKLITDAYVKKVLSSEGIAIKYINKHPELIELKRSAIKIMREIMEIQRSIYPTSK